MRLLLLGATGLLGSALRPALAALGDVAAPGRAAIDLARPDEVEARVHATGADAIVVAAAQADVDRAEREPDEAFAVNAQAVGAVGRAAARLGAPVVHVSTDYVFDGEKGAPYVETDRASPLCAYGRSKLEGERALLAAGADAVILRTAWLMGAADRSFVGRMLALARTRDVLEVADDQSSSPTPVPELARVIETVLARVVAASREERRRLAGVYHAAGAGRASRVELVRAALELSPQRLRAREVVPVPADRFPRAAPRPLHTPLACDALTATFGVALPPWRDGLARMLRAPEGGI